MKLFLPEWPWNWDHPGWTGPVIVVLAMSQLGSIIVSGRSQLSKRQERELAALKAGRIAAYCISAACQVAVAVLWALTSSPPTDHTPSTGDAGGLHLHQRMPLHSYGWLAGIGADDVPQIALAAAWVSSAVRALSETTMPRCL
jgi:hypothetical protein